MEGIRFARYYGNRTARISHAIRTNMSMIDNMEYTV